MIIRFPTTLRLSWSHGGGGFFFQGEDTFDTQLLILSTSRFSCAFAPRSQEAYSLLSEWIDQEALTRLATQIFSPEDLGARRALFQEGGSAEAGTNKYQHVEAQAGDVAPLKMSIPVGPLTLLDIVQEIEEDLLGVDLTSPTSWLRQFQKDVRQSQIPAAEGQAQLTFKELARNLRTQVQSL